MTINKNKLKLIPIFNKSLKEIYTNKEYDMIHLYSLLKEDTEIEVPEEGNNIEQSVGTNYFYLKHEKDPNYIHIFQGSLDANKNIVNPKYIYSYDQEFFKTLDDNIKILTNSEKISKIDASLGNILIEKLLLKSIVLFINENFNNGLLNNKTSFLNIIKDVLENLNEQFTIFKQIIKKVDNKVEFKNEIDRGSKNFNINLSQLNNRFTDTVNINYYNSRKDGKIYLIEQEIKNFFKTCIDSFLILNEDIEIVQKDQELIIMKIKKIASFYTDDFDKLLFQILKINKESLEKDFRKTPSNIDEAIKILNDTNNAFSFTKKLLGKGGGQNNVKGKGELSVHLMLNTTNACTAIEPDAIIKTDDGIKNCSIKYYSSEHYFTSMQTGQKMQPNIKTAYDEFLKSLNINKLDNEELFNALFNILTINEQTKTIDVNKFKEIFDIPYNISKFEEQKLFNKNKIINDYKELKKQIASEHNTNYILFLINRSDGNFFEYIDCSNNENVANNLQISKLSAERFEFRAKKLKCVTGNYDKIDIKTKWNDKKLSTYGNIETILGYILLALDNNEAFINKIKTELGKLDEIKDRTTESSINSVYKRKGITLKEVFKNLY